MCYSAKLIVSIILVSLATTANAVKIDLYLNKADPRVSFAARDIRAAGQTRNINIKLRSISQFRASLIKDQIVLLDASTKVDQEKIKALLIDAPDGLRDEAYSIRVLPGVKATAYIVIGKDSAGAMYGGLQIAEWIQTQGLKAIQNEDKNPYMPLRGTKFNIPLDVRTPSYTDVSDAAQQNIAEMWNFDFWREYIDTLARYRYNFISLWNLHPFPSLVKVPEYPKVALDDVQRSTVQWKERYPLTGVGFDAPEIINNVETLKKISIDDKIDFWRKVMRYGKERNVDFCVVTWNIFVNGTNGQYGITDGINNKITRDYFRKSVKQLLLTYPDLMGVGLTTGENMGDAGFNEKEDWAFDTYAQGVLDAAAEMPGRKITFIHRQHQTGARDIAKKFKPVIDHPDIEFIFSFKYAKAHVFSATTQPYHTQFVKDIGELKTLWTLRNDDAFYFRWGAPDFVREFIKNIPYDVSRGFYYGSDQYIWGREFLSLEPESPRQLEVAKHWYHWLIWGRLAFDPDTGNEAFTAILQSRFPSIDATALFEAWQHASMIYPITTGFHWGPLDFQWYIESGGKSFEGYARTPSGFHDINRFISLPPHPSRDYISIPDYIDSVVHDKKVQGTTPLEVASQLLSLSDKALRYVAKHGSVKQKELRHTLDDIAAMAYLGKYYGYKIRGATELALFRAVGDLRHQTACQENLTRTAESWRRFGAIAMGQYKNPLWTNRVGHVDWKWIMRQVLGDLRSVGVANPQLESMPHTPGGQVLEAERASFSRAKVEKRYGDYSGDGYVALTKGRKDYAVTWQYNAPRTNNYIVELRYSVRQRFLGDYSRPLKINGKDAAKINLWETGGFGSWAWDRVTVKLNKGRNSIEIEVPNFMAVDSINILPAS